mmetsp:Transcript_15707/g.53639  ORF Transcript_15707/g.53639 Transcript_15707/m.53639 type:complete len:336 (-) Transcript_15707:647-1654(-)
MITVCAGRFTPHARVAVHTSTLSTPAANARSTSVRSERSMPAWWHPKPLGKSSCSSLLRLLPRSRLKACSSGCCELSKSSASPSFCAISCSCRAVFAVSLRLCTNTIACLPLRMASLALAYATSCMILCLAMAFFSLTPMKFCASGTGLKDASNSCRPVSRCTPRKRATSAGLGSVALSPTMRIMLWLVSTCRSVRLTMVSMTGPRSSFRRCTSSMMSRRTRLATLASPPLRVMTSHFSGVVTMTCVSASSRLLSCMSPVSSRTSMPSGASLRPNAPAISAASAFMGATYTTLNSSRSTVPSACTCSPTSCSSVSIAMLVLPAPVGAHTSMFSLE